MRSVDEAIDLLRRPFTGAAETAAGYGWQILHHHLPNLRAVVIRRPVDDVVEAMLRVDVEGVATYDRGILTSIMTRGDRELERISRQPGVLTVEYADLETEEACAAIFEKCLGKPFDKKWWEFLRGQKIEADVKAALRYYYAHQKEVAGFKKACKTELRHLAYSGLVGRNKGD